MWLDVMITEVAGERISRKNRMLLLHAWLAKSNTGLLNCFGAASREAYDYPALM